MTSTTPNSKQTSSNGASRSWRDLALLGGLLALVVIGLVAAAAATGWEETKIQLAKLSFSQVLILLGLSLVNYVFRGFRWHLFARRLGLPTTLMQNMRHFLGGFAMSVTPGRVGELVRMRWQRRETGWSFAKTAPLMLLDRAADLSAMALLMAIGLGMSTTGIRGGLPVTILALVAAIVATRPSLLSGLADLGYRITRRAPRLFARVRTAARSLARFTSPSVMATATVIGALGWFAEGYAFHLLLSWMGADIGLSKAIAIFIFSTLAGGLTGAPGGIGGAEAAMIALLSMEGIPLETSIPATAVIRITTLWFAIIIGLAVFPFAERQSLKVQNALEEN